MPKTHTSTKIGSRIGAIILGLFWTLFSSIFVGVGLWWANTSWQESRWEATPCQVIDFKVVAKKTGDPAFRPTTNYKYSWGSKEYESEMVLQSNKGTEDYEDIAEIEYLYKTGELDTCYVNPSDPEEASLIKQDSINVLGGIAFATFGFMFVLVGLGIIISGIKKKNSLSEEAPSETSKIYTLGGYTIAFIFFGAFALAGISILIEGIGEKITQDDSDEWVKVPATVIWNRVVSDSDNSYPEAFYRYKHNGITYRMNDKIGSELNSNNHRTIKLKAEEYPKGRKIECLVNLKEPWRSKLKQGGKGSWVVILFSLPFMLVGLCGLAALVFSIVYKKKIDLLGDKLDGSNSTFTLSKEKILHPKTSRILSIVGSMFIMLFWNGIVSVFLLEVITGHINGNPDMGLTLFIIPFVIIGFRFILKCIRSISALFAPTPIITVTPGYFIMGESTSITWQIPSGGLRMKDFDIKLIGSEEAEGDKSDSDREESPFYRKSILQKQTLQNSDKGHIKVTLPMEGIHPTWRSNNNAIRWKMIISVKIAFAPDSKEEYEVEVLSPELKAQYE